MIASPLSGAERPCLPPISTTASGMRTFSAGVQRAVAVLVVEERDSDGVGGARGAGRWGRRRCRSRRGRWRARSEVERGRRAGIHAQLNTSRAAAGIAGNIVVEKEALARVPEPRAGRTATRRASAGDAAGAGRGRARAAVRPLPHGVRLQAGGRPRRAVQAGGPQRAAGRRGQGRPARRQGAAHQRRAGGQGARPPRRALRPPEAGGPLPLDALPGQDVPAGRGPGTAEDQGAQRVVGRVLPRPGGLHRPALHRAPRPAAGRGPDHAALRQPGRLRHGRLPGQPRRESKAASWSGPAFFRGFPLPGARDPRVHFAIFAYPYDAPPGTAGAAPRAGRGRQRGRWRTST